MYFDTRKKDIGTVGRQDKTSNCSLQLPNLVTGIVVWVLVTFYFVNSKGHLLESEMFFIEK